MFRPASLLNSSDLCIVCFRPTLETSHDPQAIHVEASQERRRERTLRQSKQLETFPQVSFRISQ